MRVLLNQIDNQNYENTMMSQTNFDQTLPDKMRPEAKLAVKDEYALKETNKPINVVAYKTTTKLPNELKNELPSPEQIFKLLDHIQ